MRKGNMNRHEPDISIDCRSRMIHYREGDIAHIIYSSADARAVAAKLLAAADDLDGQVAL